MSEKQRNKAGLHKRISSIFDGVLVPQSDSGREPSGSSASKHTEYAHPKQSVQELQKSESPKPSQAEQILPEAVSNQETEAEPAQEPKDEPVQETEAKPVQELKDEPVQEPEDKPVQEPKDEPVQEPEAKPAHTPKFMTAQESKVVPIQETDAEPVQKPKAEPVQESGAKPANQPQFVTAKKDKLQTTQKSKVIPLQRPEADNGNIAKKRNAVKVVRNGFWGQITDKLFAPKQGVSTTKQKVMVVMLPVLFILLLIFVFRGGVFGTSENKVEAGGENNASSIVSADLNAKIDWKIPETYPETLRDPMKLGPVERVPDQNGSGGLVELTVKSILYSEDNSSVVIGKNIFHEGEQVRGVRIIKINKDNVEFEMNGRVWSQKVQR